MPFGRELVVTVTGVTAALIVRFKAFAAELAEAESVAVTFTVPLNAAVGVPVI